MKKQPYTALIRKGKLEYVAICLELNVSARGADLAETEENLKNAIEAYLEDFKEHPETIISPISTDELIEFLRDTEPDWLKEETFIRPLEVHEIPSYV
jgi:predicted RNase H-like HicB family nuclease